jgi:hypothetical protein
MQGNPNILVEKMLAELSIKTGAGESLPEFASRVFSILNISKFEERQSANYVEGRYFRGLVLGVAVDIAIADCSRFQDLSFWVTFEVDFRAPSIDDDTFLAGLADLTARILVIQGYEVFKDERPGRIDSQWFKYKLVNAKKPNHKGAIVIEEYWQDDDM